MGAIADLAVPEGGAIAALPVPGTENAVTPDQLDTNTFTATAGPFRRGLRSGFNSIGANISALIGQTGEALGLTEFANDRFQDAANFADFADRVGPPVRDFGAVKDAETLSKFVAGMAGQGAATSTPALGLGLALRRPVAGVMAGSFPLEAGEQVQNLRADPEVLRTQSPGRILSNSIVKGGVNAAIDATLGAESQALKKVLKPGLKTTLEGTGKAVGKAVVGEGATEGVQNLVGQTLHQDLNPNMPTDWHEALNDALAGAAGGGVIGAGGHVAGMLPGGLAKSADELRTRLGKKEKPPVEEPTVDDITEGMNTEQVADLLGDFEDKNTKFLDKVWGKIKEHPGAQKFKDWATDEEQRNALNEELKTKYRESTFKPQVDAAVAKGKTLVDGIKLWAERRGKKDESKKSAMRTRVDDQILDSLKEFMPVDNWASASSGQLKELSDVIKQLALEPDYFAETSVPHELRKAFSGNFTPLMERAVELVHGPESRTAAMKKVKAALTKHDEEADTQLENVQNLVRTHLKDDYTVRSDMREAAIDELAPQLLDYVHNRGQHASKSGYAAVENVSPGAMDPRFHAAMEEAFGANVGKVRAGLDELHSNLKSRNVFEEDENADDTPFTDQRLNKVYSMKEFGQVDDDIKALEEEYGRKNVTIHKHIDRKTNQVSLSMEPADENGLDSNTLKRARESKKHNRSGIENGIISVKTDDNPQGAKINLVNLTKEMIRREGHLTKEGDSKYMADMVMRGIASLLNTESVKGFTDHTRAQLVKGGKKGWDLPDNALVAVRKEDGENIPMTWGDVKNAVKLTKWDFVDFTKHDVIMKANAIAEERAAKGWDPLSEVALRKRAVNDLLDEGRRKDIDATFADRIDRRDASTADSVEEISETVAKADMYEVLKGRRDLKDVRIVEEGRAIPRPEGDDDMITEMEKDAARKNDGPHFYEADTGTEIGAGKAPSFPETPKAPTVVPHGEGPKSPKGAKAAAKTAEIQNALNSANPKIQKATEELRKAISKKSAMNIGVGKQTEEEQATVRAYVEKVLGKKKTEVLFGKFKTAGEFVKYNDVETLKISIDAADPMSVGFHEAMHAFVQRLMETDPKVAHTLRRAAGAAPVVARLRELLKDHPAALKQLEDPDERLAYMYQFWASGEKGLLSIGPNTRTVFDKIKSFFRQIAAIWADDMTSAMAVERTNDILDAFHNGAFAERSVVAKVLNERFPPDPETQLRKFWPGLGNFMDKFVYTANGAVRDMNIPALTKIMDQFHTVTGDTEHGVGFNQARHSVNDRYLNRVVEVIKGMDDAAQKTLLDELQSGKPRTSEAAKAIEQINKELFKYMVDSGVRTYAEGKYIPLREIKENYWHRVPNQDYLRTIAGKEAFIKMLEKHGVKGAESVYDKWTQDPNASNLKDGDTVLGLSFYTPQINERTLQNIPDEEMAPFLNKDLFGTMSEYIQHAVRRSEYTSRFGNRGEMIEKARAEAVKEGATPEQLRIFDASVQAHEGTLGANIPTKLRNTYAALMTYQNVRLLPLQLFSSFVDPLGLLVRGGTVKEAFSGLIRGFRELAGVKEDDAYHLAKTVGSIGTAFDANMASSMSSAQFMPKSIRYINEKFFKYNGMESWNRSLRIAATVAAHDFIVRHVEKPTEHSERLLAELRLKAKDVKITDGDLDIQDPKIQAAINKWVDEAILRPNAAHRPIYMSDPHWMLISHLKQYSYLFQKVILSRVHNEIKHGNYSPAYALAGYVPAIIAADMMRVLITPGSGDDTARKSWDATDWLWSGIQRAGFFGPGQMGIGSAMDARQDRIPGQSLLGPTVEQMTNFIRDAAQGTGLRNELVSAVPGAKLFK